MLSDRVVWIIFAVIGPVSLVVIVGIIKGYRLSLRVEKPDRLRWWHDATNNSNRLVTGESASDSPDTDMGVEAPRESE